MTIRCVTAATVSAAIAMSIAVAQAPPAKIIILVGPPGSGKTTQAQFLAKRYQIPAFSMADLLKKEMSSAKKDRMSKALATSIASGDMLPADAATELIRIASCKRISAKVLSWTAIPPLPDRRRRSMRCYRSIKCPKHLLWCLTRQTM